MTGGDGTARHRGTRPIPVTANALPRWETRACPKTRSAGDCVAGAQPCTLPACVHTGTQSCVRIHAAGSTCSFSHAVSFSHLHTQSLPWISVDTAHHLCRGTDTHIHACTHTHNACTRTHAGHQRSVLTRLISARETTHMHTCMHTHACARRCVCMCRHTVSPCQGESGKAGPFSKGRTCQQRAVGWGKGCCLHAAAAGAGIGLAPLLGVQR